MLVQIRDDNLWLIKQHHHAMISGWLAFAWYGLRQHLENLPFELILAISLHDMAWNEIDSAPRLNSDTQRPHDFISYPDDEKSAFYHEGISKITSIHPYAGLLASLHYTSFKGMQSRHEFQEQEQKRRQQLKQQLRITRDQEGLIQIHLRYLQMFDNMSLFLCLTPPSALKESHIAELEAVDWTNTPHDQPFSITWQDDFNVVIEPFPFQSRLELHIPYSELSEKVYSNEKYLHRGWLQAIENHWSIRIIPGEKEKRRTRDTRRLKHLP